MFNQLHPKHHPWPPSLPLCQSTITTTGSFFSSSICPCVFPPLYTVRTQESGSHKRCVGTISVVFFKKRFAHSLNRQSTIQTRVFLFLLSAFWEGRSKKAWWYMQAVQTPNLWAKRRQKDTNRTNFRCYFSLHRNSRSSFLHTDIILMTLPQNLEP